MWFLYSIEINENCKESEYKDWKWFSKSIFLENLYWNVCFPMVSFFEESFIKCFKIAFSLISNYTRVSIPICMFANINWVVLMVFLFLRFFLLLYYVQNLLFSGFLLLISLHQILIINMNLIFKNFIPIFVVYLKSMTLSSYLGV